MSLSLFDRLALAAAAFALATCACAANPRVEIQTSHGKIVLELYADKAPESVENFLRYAKDGFYDGTIFHRVIDGFMIQGGGFTENMEQKPTRPPIPNEAANGLRNDIGSIAMARRNDPQSATSQFFINLADNTALNYPARDGYGYAVFGKVTQGLKVVQAIAKVPTRDSGTRPNYKNVPATPVVIRTIKVLSSASGTGTRLSSQNACIRSASLCDLTASDRSTLRVARPDGIPGFPC
jgi:peptidyl-prolyl cis-trans isomerase A (cyclophilin A)